jgi:hypothetical protein
MWFVRASVVGQGTVRAGARGQCRVFKRLSLAFILAVGLAPVAASQAAIIVANNNDEGPGSLRQAIIDAPPAETIVVPAGDYALTSGELVITKSLTIQGAGARSTILDGSGAQRVLHVYSPAAVRLTGVSVSHAKVVVPGGIVVGAGILVEDGAALNLDRAAITDNTAEASSTTGLGVVALMSNSRRPA